jgi:hypothetical protein
LWCRSAPVSKRDRRRWRSTGDNAFEDNVQLALKFREGILKRIRFMAFDVDFVKVALGGHIGGGGFKRAPRFGKSPSSRSSKCGPVLGR